MFRQYFINILKTTISDVIVVFLMILIIVNGVKIFLNEKISEVSSIINLIGVSNENRKINLQIEDEISSSSEEKKVEKNVEVKLDEENKKLTYYPSYGEKYGQIKISSIGVDLPLYFGDSLDLLKKGVGHSTWSYFPGEGGSIVCMGHNYKTMLRNFGSLKNGAKIEIKTTYGTFNYRVYDMKIVEETEMDATPIQKNKEILMIYTCYPFNNVGYTTQRYMVYAERI